MYRSKSLKIAERQTSMVSQNQNALKVCHRGIKPQPIA